GDGSTDFRLAAGAEGECKSFVIAKEGFPLLEQFSCGYRSHSSSKCRFFKEKRRRDLRFDIHLQENCSADLFVNKRAHADYRAMKRCLSPGLTITPRNRHGPAGGSRPVHGPWPAGDGSPLCHPRYSRACAD